MNRTLWIVIVIFTACVAFTAGWFSEHRPIPSAPSRANVHSTCRNAPENSWHMVQLFTYAPVKTSYMVEFQVCLADIDGRRVRVEDAGFEKVFYQYEDDQIFRVENVDLLGNHVPQLLVVTGSSGTDDRVTLHVIGEVNGQLREWTWPAYDTAAEKLLHADEDLCCKEWNFHLRGREVILAAGIYRKDHDGNCCPTRGGVVVRLLPVQDGFKIASVQRVGVPDYSRWESEPFCSQCTLTDP